MSRNCIFYNIIAFLIAVTFTGCAPRLAQTRYGAEESQWKNYISKNYRQWEPPPTPPPLAKDKKGLSVEESSLEIVPEPVNMKESLPEIKPVKEGQELKTEDDGDLSSSESKKEPAEVQYTVAKGDTLWTISKKFYNNGNKWREIQKANKKKLSDGNKLQPGMTLSIPNVSPDASY
ncbi:MAG: LysM peptidoglycan-binding domain-containing protein [Victivallales bacterium]|nr:LysM peptidoglycan-binding domain-containing protein [Victivallales bacterium]